jgi:mannose-6-phosphate isomerase class I
METALYPFFYLTARAAEPAEEYIRDYPLVFIIDGKATLNAAGGRCNFKQGDVFLLKNKQYTSYVTDTLTRKSLNSF